MGEAFGWCWLTLRCACRSLRFGISSLAVLSSLGCIKKFLHFSSENDADGRRRRRRNDYEGRSISTNTGVKRRRESYENLFEISAIIIITLHIFARAYALNICSLLSSSASFCIHCHQLCTATVPHRHTYDPICFRPSMSANEWSLRSNNAREHEDCNWTAGP